MLILIQIKHFQQIRIPRFLWKNTKYGTILFSSTTVLKFLFLRRHMKSCYDPFLLTFWEFFPNRKVSKLVKDDHVVTVIFHPKKENGAWNAICAWEEKVPKEYIFFITIPITIPFFIIEFLRKYHVTRLSQIKGNFMQLFFSMNYLLVIIWLFTIKRE